MHLRYPPTWFAGLALVSALWGLGTSADAQLTDITQTPNRAKRVAPDEKERGFRGHHVAAARADLRLQRFLNPRVRPIRGLGDVRELSVSRGAQPP